MEYTRFKLKEPIDYELLKSALVKEAEKRGWHVKDDDIYKSEFVVDLDEPDLLKKIKTYDHTELKIKGKLFDKIDWFDKIHISVDKNSMHRISIHRGDISDDELKEYMRSVFVEVKKEPKEKI